VVHCNKDEMLICLRTDEAFCTDILHAYICSLGQYLNICCQKHSVSKSPQPQLDRHTCMWDTSNTARLTPVLCSTGGALCTPSRGFYLQLLPRCIRGSTSSHHQKLKIQTMQASRALLAAQNLPGKTDSTTTKSAGRSIQHVRNQDRLSQCLL
jgi:hypothetical protein